MTILQFYRRLQNPCNYLLFIIFIVFNSGCHNWSYNEIPELNDDNEMIAYCTKKITENSNDPRYYFFRGLAYSHKDEYKKSIVDYSKAIDLDPNFIDSFYNRGLSYIKQEKYIEAIDDFNRVLKISRKPFRKSKAMKIKAYSMLGTAYMQQENFHESLFYLNKACDLDFNDFNVLQKKAMVLFYLNNFEKSFTIFTQLLKQYPDNQILMFNYIIAMGSCTDTQYIDMENLEKYSLYYFDNFPKTYQSFYIMAKLFMLQKKYHLAREYLRDSFKVYDPKLQPVLWNEMIDLQKECIAIP